jgi:hypothetical protein
MVSFTTSRALLLGAEGGFLFSVDNVVTVRVPCQKLDLIWRGYWAFLLDGTLDLGDGLLIGASSGARSAVHFVFGWTRTGNAFRHIL